MANNSIISKQARVYNFSWMIILLMQMKMEVVLEKNNNNSAIICDSDYNHPTD